MLNHKSHLKLPLEFAPKFLLCTEKEALLKSVFSTFTKEKKKNLFDVSCVPDVLKQKETLKIIKKCTPEKINLMKWKIED